MRLLEAHCTADNGSDSKKNCASCSLLECRDLCGKTFLFNHVENNLYAYHGLYSTIALATRVSSIYFVVLLQLYRMVYVSVFT